MNKRCVYRFFVGEVQLYTSKSVQKYSLYFCCTYFVQYHDFFLFFFFRCCVGQKFLLRGLYNRICISIITMNMRVLVIHTIVVEQQQQQKKCRTHKYANKSDINFGTNTKMYAKHARFSHINPVIINQLKCRFCFEFLKSINKKYLNIFTQKFFRFVINTYICLYLMCVCFPLTHTFYFHNS